MAWVAHTNDLEGLKGHRLSDFDTSGTTISESSNAPNGTKLDTYKIVAISSCRVPGGRKAVLSPNMSGRYGTRRPLAHQPKSIASDVPT